MVHPLQTEAWSNFRTTMGIDVAQLDGWYISFHRIPFTHYTIGYFPKGPLPTKKMLEELLRLGKEKNAIYIQIEPNAAGHFNLLPPSHHPLFTKYTFIIDLTKSEADLLKSMHPKTRYNIKIAEKHSVKIQEDDSHEAFETFMRLSRETTKRQGFYAHNETYARTMWNIMHKAGIARLWTATYKNEVLASWIIFVYDGVMYYPYGASSREHREVMAPNLLLWKLIKWGKSQKLQTFDLWGAIGPDPNPKDPWFGFHLFKSGFSPQLIEFIGSYDLVLKPFLYQIYCIADTIRWNVLQLLT